MSCSGCRVLRKGCNDDCILRPCLSWITSPESQANATLFLAKFYGRVGLLNLINAGPPHLRPDLFRSLLHEACGRIINPIFGSVGLIWSGNWELCQAAVESVLQGSPIMQLPATNLHHDNCTMPLEGCDIRHMYKDPSNQNHNDHICKQFKKPKGGGSQQPAAKCNISHESLSGETLEASSLEHAENDHSHGHGEESSKVHLKLSLG